VSTPKPRSGPSGSLTFFIDRDLGRIAFPAGLRAAGLSVVTLAEHYGVNGQVTATVSVDRVLDNLEAIIAACAEPGPFVYRIHPNRIERLNIDP
jgi:hypothetical protein